MARALLLIGSLWLAALVFLVLQGMLMGTINTRGLVSWKTRAGVGRASPERLQLLLITVSVAATYFTRVLSSTDTSHLPDVDTAWLAAAGASNGVYILARFVNIVRRRGARRR